MYAELVERAATARFAADFPAEGGFVAQTQKDRRYWYFQERDVEGKRRQRYLGPETPELLSRVEAHRAFKDDLRERRQLVSVLRRAGMPAPHTIAGDVLAALADAGVFRLRAVVVGTVAYQAYSGLLGMRLTGANTVTSDLDIAQFRTVSVALGDAVDVPFEAILRHVDPGFRAIPARSDPRRATQYALGDRFRVDVLAPNTGRERDAPLSLPALRTDAQPLRFLDFLIFEEEPAVALHDAGVLVNVPAPERYALHKLLVSQLRLETRQGHAKAPKDLAQAAALIETLGAARPRRLEERWRELSERGRAWRKRAQTAAELLPPAARDVLAAFDDISAA
jgi:hypothetical protein